MGIFIKVRRQFQHWQTLFLCRYLLMILTDLLVIWSRFQWITCGMNFRLKQLPVPCWTVQSVCTGRLTLQTNNPTQKTYSLGLYGFEWLRLVVNFCFPAELACREKIYIGLKFCYCAYGKIAKCQFCLLLNSSKSFNDSLYNWRLLN